MSIEAINEQLLRAIGVGVAIVDLDELCLRFRNDTFATWFGESAVGTRLTDLFPDLEPEGIKQTLASGQAFPAEVSFKMRRRTMSVALELSPALEAGEKIAVLVCQNITRIKELESMIDSYSMMVERNTLEIKREKDQVEKLLLNMMPRAAYEEYKSSGIVAPRVFEPVSVLALDFVAFDRALLEHDASVIISELNDVFSAFDRIGEQFGCERIRTNGDSYVAVSGVPDPTADHALAVSSAAVRFLRYLERRNQSHPIKWEARIGLCSGSVIGSVVGVQKYIYDVFGPAVSKALSLRARAAPMSVATVAGFSDVLDGKFTVTEVSATQYGVSPDAPVLQLTEPGDAKSESMG